MKIDSKNVSAFAVYNKQKDHAQNTPKKNKRKSSGTPKKITTNKNTKTTILFSEKRKTLHKVKNDINSDSLSALKFVLHPMKPSIFFESHWEMQPLHMTRSSTRYYNQLLTSKMLDTMLRQHPLYFTRNVDVVSYENGKRETHNPEGRAVPSAVFDYYQNGCSVRILNPQTYNKKIQMLLTNLQEYFGTMVGANVYLTPPGSQGFAPHYDDIEAFVLQLEGRKHWKLYKPK